MTATEIDGRKLRAAERREETRERILAAALAVFAEQGYHGGTTKAITQRAGVAEGLLFHYFPTKADLLVALLADDPFEPELRRSLQEHAADPVAEALPRLARRWLAVLRARRPVAMVLIQAAHVEPRVQVAIEALSQSITELLADYLAARVATGELRGIDPRSGAQLVLQALFGVTLPCVELPAGADERLLDSHIDLLLYGLLAPTAR